MNMLPLVLTISLLSLLSFNPVHGLLGNECNIYDLRSKQCDQFEICDENTNTCRCSSGYVKVDAFCEKHKQNPYTEVKSPSPNSSSLINEQKGGGSLITGFLLPLFLLISLVSLVYLTIKYDLASRIRNKVYLLRRANYDEFMIGADVDDDPPLR
ncbi:hypothetical protein HHI36_002514 [Cryptolaemus montrouzieri]|uniref:EGF-like domain-containing protein n=1 Tax=Cryptolaemus montrouzieri TaxID=559131 RepID=A0ABD2PAR3_9CUCU